MHAVMAQEQASLRGNMLLSIQVPAETLQRMEKDARNLARFINYQGAATVEWLYSAEEDAYYFLEVNPRLQVGHEQYNLIFLSHCLDMA